MSRRSKIGNVIPYDVFLREKEFQERERELGLHLGDLDRRSVKIPTKEWILEKLSHIPEYKRKFEREGYVSED